MRKYLLTIATLLGVVGTAYFYFETNNNVDRTEYESFLKNHPYYQQAYTSKELKAIPKEDRPDMAWQQDYLLTMDPALKRPTPEVLVDNYKEVIARRQNRKDMMLPGDSENEWVEHGPNNVAGRVRALVFDENDKTYKKVWAGGVTGGLWYNNDITSEDSSWHAVDGFWDNIAISAIAIDPTDANTMYVGTGEGWNQSTSGAPGAGIWKTTDGGKTWSQLEATENYHYINDLIVRDESGKGILYAAVDYSGQRYIVKPGSAAVGLYRSIDGGESFDRMKGASNESLTAADLEIGSDNRIWLGTRNSDGRIYYSDDGTTWNKAVEYDGERRVEIAVAPSDPKVVYAIMEKGGNCERIIKTTDAGQNWTDIGEPIDVAHSSDDWSRKQAWYDLIAVVDPQNSDQLYAGTIDIFSYNSTDEWKQLTMWYNSGSYPYVHADQHNMVFRPNTVSGKLNNSEIIFTNDGGVYYSDDINTSSPSFNSRNKDLNITQFYAAAIHPNSNKYYFLAGAQDNGSHAFKSDGVNATTRVTGGDGAYCFIDQEDPSYQITSYVYNTYYLSTNSGTYFGTLNRDNDKTGFFINPTDYDSKTKTLYSSHSDTALQVIKDITGSKTKEYLLVPLKSKATNIKVSPYGSDTKSNIFIGTASGRIFKVTDALSSSYDAVELNSSSFPTGAISSIDIGASENEILVTFFNYGVVSVWYSNNGGSTWINKEGDLPNMPVRWALFNPLERKEVILATEIGVWSTYDISASSPIWSPTNSGLANVRVDQLRTRSSDNLTIAATHGRGLFSSYGFLAAAPVVIQDPEDVAACTGKEVTISAVFAGKKPITYQWYHNGTKIKSANENILTIRVNDQTIGDYYCEASNELGTKKSASAKVSEHPMVQPDLGPDLNIKPEITLSLTPGSGYRTYIWSGAINQTSEVAIVKGTDLGLGTHEIIVTVYSNELCELSDTINVTVDELAGLDELNHAIQVYPNPVANTLMVKGLTTKANYQIINAKGQIVKRGSINNNSIVVSDLQKGIYFMQIESTNGLIKQRFVKN